MPVHLQSPQCFGLHVGTSIFTSILSLVSGITAIFLFHYSMSYILTLYAKQFLEIKLFTFDYHENKPQKTVD